MPTYDFKCSSCKTEFGGIFKMEQAEGKNVVCPKCGAKKVSRVYKKLGNLCGGGGCGGGCSSCAGCDH